LEANPEQVNFNPRNWLDSRNRNRAVMPFEGSLSTAAE